MPSKKKKNEKNAQARGEYILSKRTIFESNNEYRVFFYHSSWHKKKKRKQIKRQNQKKKKS